MVWHHSLLLMNSFNKTEAAVFSCRLCFLRAFPFISLILNKILNNHAPVKEKRVKYDKQPEWLTNEIKNPCLKGMNYTKRKCSMIIKFKEIGPTQLVRQDAILGGLSIGQFQTVTCIEVFINGMVELTLPILPCFATHILAYLTQHTQLTRLSTHVNRTSTVETVA